MNFLKLIGDIFTPVTALIDSVNAPEEMRLGIKRKLVEMQAQAFSEAQAYEMALLSAKSAIIVAEANGESWIQRNWRPLTMLTFLVLVVGDAFGLLAQPLNPAAWTLLQLGLGGYVVGRSAEKVAKPIAAMLAKRGGGE